jgi:hypothetical protein
MIQFYFLSIFLNALSGYVLAFSPDVDDVDAMENKFRIPIYKESFRLVLGVLTILTGLLKILSAIQGDVPVIGDLFPALAGFLAGFILIFEYYRSRSSIEPEHTEKIEQHLIKNKKWVGFLTLAAAVLHFLFPTVLLL